MRTEVDLSKLWRSQPLYSTIVEILERKQGSILDSELYDALREQYEDLGFIAFNKALIKLEIKYDWFLASKFIDHFQISDISLSNWHRSKDNNICPSAESPYVSFIFYLYILYHTFAILSIVFLTIFH
jgi:hypothetical protein